LSANGNVSASYVPQLTCPGASKTDRVICPLLNDGCYAEFGHVGFTTNRLNSNASKRKRSIAALRVLIAYLEARAIRALTGLRQFRGHVVGDCPDAKSATLIGSAMVAHERKHGKAAWIYTHWWPIVARSAWQGANVLASCNNTSEIAAARARGFGTACVVPPHPTNKIYELNGELIVPCPAQFKHNGRRIVTCEFCTLCKRPDFLLEHKLSVGFEPDSGTTKRVMPLTVIR